MQPQFTRVFWLRRSFLSLARFIPKYLVLFGFVATVNGIALYSLVSRNTTDFCVRDMKNVHFVFLCPLTLALIFLVGPLGSCSAVVLSMSRRCRFFLSGVDGSYVSGLVVQPGLQLGVGEVVSGVQVSLLREELRLSPRWLVTRGLYCVDWHPRPQAAPACPLATCGLGQVLSGLQPQPSPF